MALHDTQVKNEYDFINKAILGREQQRQLLPPEYYSACFGPLGPQNYIQRVWVVFETVKNLEPRLAQLETVEKQKVEAARMAAIQAQQAEARRVAAQQAALAEQNRQAEALRIAAQQAAIAEQQRQQQAQAAAERLERQRLAEEQARQEVQRRLENERQARIAAEAMQRHNEQKHFVETTLSERTRDYEGFFKECQEQYDVFLKETAALQRNLGFFETFDSLQNTQQTSQKQNGVNNIAFQVTSTMVQ